MQRIEFTLAQYHYRALWALTPLFSPLPQSGGFVSVALFLRLRAVAVSNYPTLRCPDFPLAIFQASDYSRASTILTYFPDKIKFLCQPEEPTQPLRGAYAHQLRDLLPHPLRHSALLEHVQY